LIKIKFFINRSKKRKLNNNKNNSRGNKDSSKQEDNNSKHNREEIIPLLEQRSQISLEKFSLNPPSLQGLGKKEITTNFIDLKVG
jgi:hypothetical protein